MLVADKATLDSAPWNWCSAILGWAANTSTIRRRGTCSGPYTPRSPTASRPDTVLLLEHASVYTAGKRTEPQERPVDGTPVIDVDRGGKITWHGPGQLVGYPIVRLPESVLVVDYVRRLEEALITMLASYGLQTGRIRGRSGVWLAGDDRRLERKIAAIGVRVAAGTTMHGFALNVDPDLRSFDRIIPCGLTGVGVTSMTAELGRHVTVSEAAQVLRPQLQHYLAFEEYTQSPDVGSAPETRSPQACSWRCLIHLRRVLQRAGGLLSGRLRSTTPSRRTA